MPLRLTMGFSDNPRVQPMKDGLVKPQGIELDCVTLDPSNLFQRNLTYDEFDVSEMSVSETLLARERTDGTRWDWSARPAIAAGLSLLPGKDFQEQAAVLATIRSRWAFKLWVRTSTARSAAR